MEQDNGNILFLGIGNYLMGDEGVGVMLARRLAEMPLPPGVDVLDGGTGGFHLMGPMEQYSTVFMADATLDGRPAGTIRLIEPRFSKDFPRVMSTHEVGLRDVVEAMSLRGTLPKIHLYLISVEEVQPMLIGLSPAVEAAVEALLPRIMADMEAAVLMV